MQDHSDIRYFTITNDKYLIEFTNHKIQVNFPSIPEPYNNVVFKELFEKYRIDLEDGNEELWKDFINYSKLFKTYVSYKSEWIVKQLGFKRDIVRERNTIKLLYGDNNV